jgi:hypothetical protein
MEYTRLVQYAFRGELPYDVLDKDFERLLLMVKQVRRDFLRSVRPSDLDDDASMVLPMSADRAGKFLGFDGDGNAISIAAVTSTALTPDSVGGALWPRTAGEVAAGVTPTAGGYRYEPGDVRRYGAVGGGAATDTTSVNQVAIQAALDSNDHVWLQPKTTYMCAWLKIWSNTTFDLNGGTLKLIKDANDLQGSLLVGPAAIQSGGNPVYFDASRETVTENVVIKNGTLDGNLVNNQSPTPGTWGDWTSAIHLLNGILIRGEANNIHVENMSIHHYQSDGILTFLIKKNSGADRVFPNGLTCVDVDFGYNGRQGMSNSGGTFQQFTRCKFHHTGVPYGNALHPNGPFAGVDIESEGQICESLIWTDCEFYENRAWGLILSYSGYIKHVRINGCYFHDNGFGKSNPIEFEVAAGGSKSITDVVCSNTMFRGRCQVISVAGFVGPAFTGATNGLREVTFNNCSIGDATANKVAVFTNYLGAGSVLSFNNCNIQSARDNNSDAVIVAAGGQDAEFYFTNCVVKNNAASSADGHALLLSGIRTSKFFIHGGSWTAPKSITFTGGPSNYISVGGGAEISGGTIGSFWRYGAAMPIYNRATLTSAVSAGATILPVSDPEWWQAGSIISIEKTVGGKAEARVISVDEDAKTVTIAAGSLTGDAASGNGVWFFYESSTQTDAAVTSGAAIIPVHQTVGFVVGDHVRVEGVSGAMVRVIASIQDGVSLTVTSGISSDIADNETIYKVQDVDVRLGDCVVKDSLRAIHGTGGGVMNATISAAADTTRCTNASSGVKYRISQITGSATDPSGAVAAGKGSTYQSSDGSVWKNTNNSTGWTEL